mmetsp:Transcript_27310/g.64010  ORF Transcript_27310/g.64010 Transcript_27310/m.64010 type:complete len:80 (+) Transcript_27310:145-384(+)
MLHADRPSSRGDAMQSGFGAARTVRFDDKQTRCGIFPTPLEKGAIESNLEPGDSYDYPSDRMIARKIPSFLTRIVVSRL